MRRALAGTMMLLALGVSPASAGAIEVPLYNQSFEDPKIILDPDTLPKPTGWIYTGPNGTGTVFQRIEDPTAPDGDWVLEVTTDGSEGLGGVHSPSTGVEPEGTYTVRMTIKVPLGRPLWPAISERDAEDEQLVFDEGPKYVGTGGWDLIEYTREFGPEGVNIRGYWRMGGSEAGVFYLDAVPPPQPEPEPLPLPPSPTPPAPPPATTTDVPPTISAFGLTRRRFAPTGSNAPRRVPRGTRFTYTLSERASVAISIIHGSGTVATLNASKQSGTRSTTFSGRSRGAPLKPGAYLARIVATDSAGQTSEPRHVSFLIAKS